ncbi:hypothetical protein [Lebetimonas sp. JS138]|nr:hypothetical protein [Lebetimonas sp. JS138]
MVNGEWDASDVIKGLSIYSDVDDKINDDKFKNTRVFVNYAF